MYMRDVSGSLCMTTKHKAEHIVERAIGVGQWHITLEARTPKLEFFCHNESMPSVYAIRAQQLCIGVTVRLTCLMSTFKLCNNNHFLNHRAVGPAFCILVHVAGKSLTQP